jgi:hypothetical protein
MFSRFSRSYQLVRMSAAVLRANMRLMIFPLLSSIAALAVLVSFVLVFFAAGERDLERPAESGDTLVLTRALDGPGAGRFIQAQYTDDAPANDVSGAAPGWQDDRDFLLLALFYLVEYFVIIFFNTALAGAALMYMRGEQPTVSDGLSLAFSKLGTILGYAVIAASVGLVLRAIEERVGLIGRLVVSLLGVAWTVATFLVVPVLVSRDVGPLEAVKQSATLLKQTWGENIIANAGLGGFIGIATLVPWGDNSQAVLAWFVALVLALLLAGLVHATLQGIFSAALYHHATEGERGDPQATLSADVLSQAFITRA